MTVDIGSETLGGAAVNGTLEKGYATKRECKITGNCAELAVTVEATNKCKGVKLGIYTELAGAVHTFLAETPEIKITELKAETVKGTLETAQALVSGVSYFLCAVPVAGTTFKFKATEKAAWGFKTTAAVKKVSEGTWTTAENKWGEPAPIWGIEEAVVGSTAQCKTTVLIGDSAQVRQNQAVQPVGSIRELGKVSGNYNAVAGIVATYRFKDQGAVVVTNAAQALTKLRFEDSATPQAIIQAGATAKVVIAKNVTAPNVRQAVGATAKLVFAGKAHAIPLVEQGKEEKAAGKKVAVFVFED